MNKKDIEDIYPLSPLQEGLLFESLQSPGAGVYFEQLKFRFEQGLDLEAWKAAWEKVVQRHQMLRTAILWQNQDRILQVVCKSVSIPWQTFDWREMPPPEQQTRLNTLLEKDRDQGFDFGRAPLLRMTLVRLTDLAYEFICSHHHILLDGWSTSILLKEVLGHYRDSAPRPNPVPPRQYKDYVRWLEHQDLLKAEHFWRKAMANFGTPTRLSVPPVDAQPPVRPKEQELKTALDHDLTAKLRFFAGSKNITLNALVTAAWALLLSRYSGQDDVVFGVTMSVRPAVLDGIESMVGLFINTLPLRVLTPPHARIERWLQELQMRLLDVQDYAYSPLPQVQRWTEIPPGIPLFESMVVFDNYPADLTRREIRTQFGITDISSIEWSSFPLGLVATPGPQLLLKFGFDPRHFNSATIETMQRSMTALLEELIRHPNGRLSDVCILTSGERRLILETWNQTRRDYPLDTTIHELFEARASLSPDAPAILCEGQQLAFKELNARANQLAHHLRSLGAGPDTIVAICIERCLEMIIGLLGILKSGAGYAPLDPSYPADRLHLLMEDSSVSILVTKNYLVSKLSHPGLQTVCLDSDWDQVGCQSVENPLHRTVADNVAYCIYTSGSTGKPKGVLIPHRGICNTLQWIIETLSLGSNDRVLLSLSFSFDASVWQIFGSFIAGSCLVISGSREFDSAETVATIIEQSVTATDFVPSMLQIFLDEPNVDRCQSLRHVLCGGEAMTADLRDKFFRHLGARLLNVYGPTEISIDAAFCTCTPQDRNSIVPIGRPIANKQLYVLDPQLQPVPLGVSGELYIGGEGLARGYLKRPDLTADRFVPDPFGKLPGARIYKTGDVARFMPDGSIQYIGRVDSQVKIRGFRVEVGEIEAILATHPDVRECVVVARGDVDGGKQLLAYVITENTKSPFKLQNFLEGKLPGHMVPAQYVFLDKLPTTPVGKIDRDRLPLPVQSGREITQSYGQAGTPIDEYIAEIWSQILGKKGIGPQDNFFVLGGHSLSAVRVISRLRAAFKAEFPLRILFDFPTLSAFAGAVKNALTKNGNQPPPLVPLPRIKPPRMSFAQQRLWFVDQLVPHSPLYNMHLCLRFDGILEVEALQQALDGVVARHEALRTTFAEVDGELIQVIAPQMKIPLTIIDVSTLPKDERSKKTQQISANEANRAFDLTKGPLLRGSLLRLDERSHNLFVTVHHIVADGWSISILLGELAAFYKCKVTRAEAELPGIAIQYADFAEWQQNWLKGDVLRSELDYWKEQLQSAPALTQLPTDRPRPATQTFSGAVYSFTIPGALVQPLQFLCREEIATMFMVLLAAFKVLLYRYSSQESVVIASPAAGRNRKELEHAIGLFINTIVFHTRFSGEATFREALRRVREVSLGAYMHQDVPFEKIVEDLQPARDASYTPVFQVMFDLQPASANRIEFPQLTYRSIGVESHTAKFDLTLDLLESDCGLHGSFEYSTDLFDATTITRMAGHFHTLIAAVSRNPDQKISDLEFITEAEKQQLIASAAQPSTNGKPQFVHRLIEMYAERTPLAPAVVLDDRRMTYGELNRRANQLAFYLRTLGIGREDIVAVCIERSPELIVALLAIWKTGAAYVPLDPSYPYDRLALMIEQVRAPVLVTVENLRLDLLSQAPKFVRVDFESGVFSQGHEENLPNGQDPDSLAYVIFTSGSTGRPKGVMVSHANLFSVYVGWEQSYNLPNGLSSHLQMANFSFDVFVGDLTRALCSGGKLVICRQEVLLDPAKLYALMQAEAVDFAEFVPAVLRILAAHMESANRRLDSLRILVAGSDSWYASEYESVRKYCRAGTRIINSYGVTEATIDSTFFEGQIAGLLSSDRLVPIGSPFPNQEVFLLDRNLRLVPAGVPGELCIGGPGVARGYLGQPDLTAEKFVPHPFSRETGARLYRTGDLARYLPDNTIELIGRTDNLVKVRGFRIELGEIEAVLAQHPSIANAVVVVRSSSADDKRLVVYFVSEDRCITVQKLREFLQSRLPTYMVPASFICLDALPLLPNGKIDRQALPLAGPSTSQQQLAYVAPRDNIETDLAEIWAHVLQINRVSINDNFFDIGGHSLLALRLVAELEKRFNRRLPLSVVFQKGTIKELATLLRSQIAPATSALVPLNPAGTRPPLFLVHVGSGNVLCYIDLVRRLGQDQPFYGLQDPTLSGVVPPFSSIEEMAAFYVREMQTVQPKLPYLIGGWSFGGLVAFEMARQLSALGQYPALVAILDSGTPDMEREFESRMDDAALLAILAHEMSLPIASRDLRGLDSDQQLQMVADHMSNAGVIFEDPIGYLRRQLDIFNYRNKATLSYFPGPYCGRISLFLATQHTDVDSGDIPENLAHRWAKFAKEVDVYQVPGSHHEIAREPHVQSLARLLRDCITKSLNTAGYSATASPGCPGL